MAMSVVVSLFAVGLVGFVIGWLVKQKNVGSTISNLEGSMRQLRDELEGAQAAGSEAEARAAGMSARTDELRSREEGLTRELEDERSARLQLTERLASTEEALKQERRQSAEKLALLTGARDEIVNSFKVLAADALKQQGEAFSSQNREQVEAVLNPLRLKIIEFRDGLQKAHIEGVKDRAALAEQIRSLNEASTRMTSETQSLTRALRGDSQKQGAWGEMILATILEHSGLREGEEFVTQETNVGEDGKRVRPDVFVNLPGGQRVIIDSKLSLTAYEEYCAAGNDDEKSEALARHVVSMTTHIKSLGGKAYQTATETGLDFVIMFVPIEGALAAAVSSDAKIPSLATERNVAIGTPTTLMMALRTIASVWHVERRHRNAEEIANRAGRLYDKFVGFVDDMRQLGGRINAAQTAWNDALSKLSSGRGNLVRQVETLKEMGARTQKSLPRDLVEAGEPEMLLEHANHDLDDEREDASSVAVEA